MKCKKTIIKQNYENLPLHQVKKDWIKPMIAWNNIALIMRNKSDLDTLRTDASTNETVNTAHSVYAASSKDQASNASYANDVMFSFFANSPMSIVVTITDLEQLLRDLDEMDLNWPSGNAYP
ncbi:hypothetical protein Tco_0448388 [Tanacetum coccineum]